MSLGKLIIFSGLPGSGKSTLASKLAAEMNATYLRIDTIEQGLKDICGLTQIQGEGYQLAYRLADENLRAGNAVIADSVNPWELTRNEWNDVAKRIGAQFINIEIKCSDKSQHQMRAETRGESAAGLKNPTWEEILNRDYHHWKEGRYLLDTAGKTVDESFEELLSILKKAGFYR